MAASDESIAFLKEHWPAVVAVATAIGSFTGFLVSALSVAKSRLETKKLQFDIEKLVADRARQKREDARANSRIILADLLDMRQEIDRSRLHLRRGGVTNAELARLLPRRPNTWAMTAGWLVSGSLACLAWAITATNVR